MQFLVSISYWVSSGFFLRYWFSIDLPLRDINRQDAVCQIPSKLILIIDFQRFNIAISEEVPLEKTGSSTYSDGYTFH